MKKQIIWFVPSIVVASGIFALSTFLAIPIQIEGVGYLDKIEHSLAYFVLILTFLVAFKRTGRLTRGVEWGLLIICSFYGLMLEFTQYALFPDRYFEWIDAGANLLGVLIGWLMFKLFSRG